jgi:hypothetical protein
MNVFLNPRKSLRYSLLTSVVLVGFVSTSAAWGAPDSFGYSAPEVRKLDSRGSVEVKASVVASDDESPSHARSRALGLARQAAVEFVAGVKIKTGTLSFDQVHSIAPVPATPALKPKSGSPQPTSSREKKSNSRFARPKMLVST